MANTLQRHRTTHVVQRLAHLPIAVTLQEVILVIVESLDKDALDRLEARLDELEEGRRA